MQIYITWLCLTSSKLSSVIVCWCCSNTHIGTRLQKSRLRKYASSAFTGWRCRADKLYLAMRHYKWKVLLMPMPIPLPLWSPGLVLCFLCLMWVHVLQNSVYMHYTRWGLRKQLQQLQMRGPNIDTRAERTTHAFLFLNRTHHPGLQLSVILLLESNSKVRIRLRSLLNLVRYRFDCSAKSMEAGVPFATGRTGEFSDDEFGVRIPVPSIAFLGVMAGGQAFWSFNKARSTMNWITWAAGLHLE